MGGVYRQLQLQPAAWIGNWPISDVVEQESQEIRRLSENQRSPDLLVLL